MEMDATRPTRKRVAAPPSVSHAIRRAHFPAASSGPAGVGTITGKAPVSALACSAAFHA